MRYLPLTPSDRQAMLGVIGANSIDDLFVDVPAAARLDGPIRGLPNHASEMVVERHFSTLARKNMTASEHPFFLGAGAYKHHAPRRRLDETQAARKPVLVWREPEQAIAAE